MQATRALLHRQPMIRFVGKRTIPVHHDSTPRSHPEAPTNNLPESFARYREQATQHGPLKTTPPSGSSAASPSSQSVASAASSAPQVHPLGVIGGQSAKALGPIRPGSGEFWDRSELPQRFHRAPMTQAEIDAIETGGASMFA